MSDPHNDLERAALEEGLAQVPATMLRKRIDAMWAEIAEAKREHGVIAALPITMPILDRIVPMSVALARTQRQEQKDWKEELKRPARASIDYTYAAGGYRGRDQACVIGTCESGHEVGPIWGHGPRSVKRLLATMTEECPCGKRFHEEFEEEAVLPAADPGLRKLVDELKATPQGRERGWA